MLSVVIMSQYIHISKHYAVHLKIIQCYMSTEAGKVVTESEMVGWHHQLNGHELEPTPGDSEAQGNLACCRPEGGKESHRLRD